MSNENKRMNKENKASIHEGKRENLRGQSSLTFQGQFQIVGCQRL